MAGLFGFKRNAIDVQKPLLCLVGYHGTGKTSIARYLAENCGYKHISVGDLARLARKGRMPSDVHSTVMILLARTKPGDLIDAQLAQRLMNYLNELRQTTRVVIDGFPATPEHLLYMDKGCNVAHITLDESIREERLVRRGELTKRKWTPGGVSKRDVILPETLEAVKKAGLPFITQTNHTATIATAVNGLRQWMGS